MCGICGILNLSDRAAIESMVTAMHHRGPDDRGTFLDEHVGLGMSRLAIIDISPAGHQPMSTPDGLIWIVFNGEIYNFKSERLILEKQGCSFHSNSDTEVVLRLYEKYGDDFLLRLRGMFALAIFDKRKGPGHERLMLARDPLGIKPLLYSENNSRLVFASELKAMLASGLVEREVDPEALRLLLTFGSVYQPHTMLQGVKSLLPGHRLVMENGRKSIEPYWSFGLDRCKGLRERPYEEQVEQLAAMLQESVDLHMVSDVPVGAFLSGGVDSSLLVGLMTRLAGHRIKTFAVGYEKEGADIDESDEAGLTAAFLGADHTRAVITGEMVRQHLEKIAGDLDQPSVDGVNSYFVSMVARQTVTVSISGTGGDELFAGYPWFPKMILEEQKKKEHPWKYRYDELLTGFSQNPLFDPFLLGKNGMGLKHLREKAGFVTRYAGTYQIFGSIGAANLLAPSLRKGAHAGRAEANDLANLDELPVGAAVERVSALVMRGYLQNQLLRDIDAVSMAHSLEIRVPFLDIPLTDLAFSLPASAKLKTTLPDLNPWLASYRQMGSKRILIDAGKLLGVLRDDIDLQPKRGFGMPFAHWLKGTLSEVMDDTLSPSVVLKRGWFEPVLTAQVRQDFLDGKTGWAFPWSLMIAELWARKVLDL